MLPLFLVKLNKESLVPLQHFGGPSTTLGVLDQLNNLGFQVPFFWYALEKLFLYSSYESTVCSYQGPEFSFTDFETIQTLFKVSTNTLISILTVCYYHVTYKFQSESTIYGLPECQGTPCSKQAPYLKSKWQQWDSNPQPLSSWTNTECFNIRRFNIISLCPWLHLNELHYLFWHHL